ncbi:type IV pilus assembly protein PilN [Geothermobacter ehrlichii]|uniref:Type IV pilus assembly protein PilN n=1 Tax=Geothermobacter ehrlichii TaxID=213224 RepID=A0A5D3WJJ7_9BACT|nr:PilN domain-containing protein [Geothermobacter ehrlichii]TYO98737.1 type IV pilus assembly protein PilN [Geothermobacter ehrlichii]
MKPTINLATHEHLNRRAVYGVYALVGLLLLLALVFNLHAWFAGRAQLQRLDARIAELQQQLGIDESAPPVSDSDFARLQARIRFANRVIERDSYRWSLLLGHLERVLPRQVRISTIHPLFKEGKIRLSGEARSIADLQLLLDRLVASKFFSEVLILSQQTVDDPAGGDLVGFRIEVRGGGA